jgi:uncharacterized protein (DUF1778 family)
VPETPTAAVPPRTKAYFSLTIDDRHWFKAAAALEGMTLEEWLYAMAVRRAQEMGVPRPFRRPAD